MERLQAAMAAEEEASAAKAKTAMRNRNVLASRVKRIMQADEEVGKIAAATPVTIARGLELFLADMVQSTVESARLRASRTLTASHLKEAVQGSASFDFLNDVVASASDPGPKLSEQEIAEAFERAGQRNSKSKGKNKATTSGAAVERAEGEWDSEEECYVVKKPVKKKPAKPRGAPKVKATATTGAAGADGGVKRTAEQAFAGGAGGDASTSASVKAEEGAGAAEAAAAAEEPYIPPAAAAAAATGLPAFASGGLDDDYDEDSD